MGWIFLRGLRLVADPCEFLTNLHHFVLLLLLLFILLPLLLFLLFFLKHYSPFRTLASSTIFLYFRRSLTIACLLFIPILLKSSSSFHHLLPGLPIFLVLSITSIAICFGIRWFCILSTSESEGFYKFYQIFPSSNVSYTVWVHRKFILIKWETFLTSICRLSYGSACFVIWEFFVGSKAALAWSWLSVFELQDEESVEILQCSRGLHGTVLNAHGTVLCPWHSTMHMSQCLCIWRCTCAHGLLYHFLSTFPKKTLISVCRGALRQNCAHFISVKFLGLGKIVIARHPWILTIF